MPVENGGEGGGLASMRAAVAKGVICEGVPWCLVDLATRSAHGYQLTGGDRMDKHCFGQYAPS